MPDARTLPQVEGRDIATLQDARPINIIGSANGSEVCFATVIWTTPLSHTPPMIAFALRAKSRTMQLIQTSGALSISTLLATQQGIELTEFCGSHSGNSINKGDAVEHFFASCETETGAAEVPVPTCAYSWEICRVKSIQETGDHLLVIAEVCEAHIDAPKDVKGRLIPDGTLLCVQHECYGVCQEI